MSISNAVLECVQILTPAQNDKALSPNLRQELADILVRLKIWAGNVGIFAPDNASVDCRLRDDPDLVEVVFSMTRKLKQSLFEAIHPPLLEESDGEGDEGGQERVADPASSGSSSASLKLDSSVEESNSGDDLERLGASAIFVEEANNVIDRLYRLATVFRKPVSFSENAKIRDFMKKRAEKGDVEELEDVEDHARCHIKVQCPRAPEFLVSRLVEAVVFRRMKIRYRQRHQAKLNQGIEPAFATPALYAPYGEGTATPAAGPRLSSHPSGKRDSTRGTSRPPPAPRSVAFSATIASSINRAKFADYAKSTALSGITKAAVSRRQQLDVPPPPNERGQDKLECPYCLRIVSQEEMTQPRWTRHILKDIDPLVCLFEDCKESLTLFKTVEEWLGHMRWQHTIVHSCQAVGHERDVFTSSQELEDHIRGEHPDTFTESQLPGLLQQGAVPVPNTIGALNLSLSLNKSECLLCHTFEPQPVDAKTVDDAGSSTPEQTVQDHILEHLEAIALLALPAGGGADSVDSDARQQSPGPNAETKKEIDDIPLAVFEDIVAERAEDESVPDQDGHDDCWAAVIQVKQPRLQDPHEDPILVQLGEGRKRKANDQAVIGKLWTTEGTCFFPTRQPRGPPSIEELKARPSAKHEASLNFAARTRRSAVNNHKRASSDAGDLFRVISRQRTWAQVAGKFQEIVLPERIRDREADFETEHVGCVNAVQDAAHENLSPDPATFYFDQRPTEPSHELYNFRSSRGVSPALEHVSKAHNYSQAEDHYIRIKLDVLAKEGRLLETTDDVFDYLDELGLGTVFSDYFDGMPRAERRKILDEHKQKYREYHTKADIPGYHRAGTACTNCRKQKIRCVQTLGPKCEQCQRFHKECVIMAVDQQSSTDARNKPVL